MRLATLALATCLSFAIVPLAFAQEEEVAANIENVQGNSEAFFELFGKMQDAVMFDKPTDLVADIDYPITIVAKGKTYEVEDEEQMLDNFNVLFSKKALEAIRTQDVGALIVTSEGVGFGDGEVWVANICDDDACANPYWGITAINN